MTSAWSVNSTYRPSHSPVRRCRRCHRHRRRPQQRQRLNPPPCLPRPEVNRLSGRGHVLWRLLSSPPGHSKQRPPARRHPDHLKRRLWHRRADHVLRPTPSTAVPQCSTRAAHRRPIRSGCWTTRMPSHGSQCHPRPTRERGSHAILCARGSECTALCHADSYMTHTCTHACHPQPPIYRPSHTDRIPPIYRRASRANTH
mmetsp:Transcript_36605/g.72934  ORF Transcript_36605/g.72934 Transcript_36605/m.72934 type:complete len:200 (+) Transcript_36605:465-1064(+)